MASWRLVYDVVTCTSGYMYIGTLQHILSIANSFSVIDIWLVRLQESAAVFLGLPRYFTSALRRVHRFLPLTSRPRCLEGEGSSSGGVPNDLLTRLLNVLSFIGDAARFEDVADKPACAALAVFLVDHLMTFDLVS